MLTLAEDFSLEQNAATVVALIRNPAFAHKSDYINEQYISNFNLLSDSARFRLICYRRRNGIEGKLSVATVARVLEGIQ